MLTIKQVLEIFDNDTDYLHFKSEKDDQLGYFISGPKENMFLSSLDTSDRKYVKDISDTEEFFIIRCVDGKQTVINSIEGIEA